jgi:putative transposase
MKNSRFSEQQIGFVLRQAEEGTPIAEVCRKAGISEASFYSWRKKYGGLLPSEMKRLKRLNGRSYRHRGQHYPRPGLRRRRCRRQRLAWRPLRRVHRRQARRRRAIFNDAAIGRDRVGIGGLDYLQELSIAAAAVGHDTARIGGGADMLECSVITHTNVIATSLEHSRVGWNR